MAVVTKIMKKSLNLPDETRQIGRGKLELVSIGGTQAARITLLPGWKWSQDVRPLVGTESCRQQHVQYVISGRLMIAMDDGESMELGPGDYVVIPPGHDGWVLGNEPCVLVDFSTDVGRYGSRLETSESWDPEADDEFEFFD